MKGGLVTRDDWEALIDRAVSDTDLIALRETRQMYAVWLRDDGADPDHAASQEYLACNNKYPAHMPGRRYWQWYVEPDNNERWYGTSVDRPEWCSINLDVFLCLPGCPRQGHRGCLTPGRYRTRRQAEEALTIASGKAAGL